MKNISRLVRGAPGRQTRLHTYRGEFIGKSGLAEVPRCVLMRLRPPTKPQPWLNAKAIDLLDRSLNLDSRVAEFGGGDSTLWFAVRSGFVLCFEDDPQWVADLRGRLGELVSAAPVEFRVTDDFPSAAAELESASFDVVVVDHNERNVADRVATLRMAMEAVSLGGLLVLDDSDRPEYSEADMVMTGWSRVRLTGLRPRPLQASETTAYRRPEW